MVVLHLLDCNFFFFLRIKRSGQWAMTIHYVTLVLLKIEVVIQTSLDTRPFTLDSERTVAHTSQYDNILYYPIHVLHCTLTSHINGTT